MVLTRIGELFALATAGRRVATVEKEIRRQANPVEVVVAETGQGRGVLGVVDGAPPAYPKTARLAVDTRRLLVGVIA